MPLNGKDDANAKIRELCSDGLGYAFDTTGLKPIIQGALKQLGKGRLITEEDTVGSELFTYRDKLMKGIPNLQEFGLYNWRGGGGSM